jgi:hypothetical protein
MRAPAGLDAAGKKLWRSVADVFDLTEEPGKVQLLAQACRVADVVAELDEAADQAPLTTKGSWANRSSARSSRRPGCSGAYSLNCSGG